MDVFKTLILDTPDSLNNISGVLPIVNGGTGADNASDARDNLGLGNSATLDVGTTAGTVAAGDDSRFLGGDVVGPASSTDNAVVRYDGTTGKLVQDSTVTIDDSGTVAATSLDVSDNTTLGTSNGDTVDFNARIASEFTPATDNTYDLGRTGHEWRDLYIDGTANIDSLVADTADIDGGTIDGASIGATTPSTGAFTTLSATGVLNVLDAVNYNGTGAMYFRSRLNGGSVYVGTESTGGTLYYPITINGTNDTLTFSNQTGEAMRIDSAGKVGIGTTSPERALTVAATQAVASLMEGTSTSGTFLDFGNSNYHAGSLARVGIDASGDMQVGAPGAGGDLQLLTASSTRLTILNANGNVGIGTTSPAYQLQLSTDSAAKPSTNTWTIASDARIKTETGEYTKGLDAVLALRPVTYRYNGKAGMIDDGEDKISIIAQEAITAFPECVGSYMVKLEEDDEQETEVLNWNGHALTFALVNSIKELTARLEALENN